MSFGTSAPIILIEGVNLYTCRPSILRTRKYKLRRDIMKKQIGIWIDGSKAVVVTIENGNSGVKIIESKVENSVHHSGEGKKGSKFGSQAVDTESKHDQKKLNQYNDYFNMVLGEIKQADDLYVFGPAEAKIGFQKTVAKDQSLNSKLRAVEVADSMTENQVVAHVKAFFENLA